MKKSAFSYLIFILFLIISGCCGRQLQVFNDGNYYYPNWCQYNSCKPNGSYADCYKDNKFVETIYPLTANEVAEIRYQEMLGRQAWSDAMNSLGNIKAPTRTNCYNFGNRTTCTTY
ncbi:hypothetical protein ADMFC3_19110 [Geovibrio sp. ADMFC3]